MNFVHGHSFVRIVFATICTFLIVFGAASLALSDDEPNFKCDRDGTYCLVTQKRLVVGDWVVIVSDKDEVIALGEVEEFRGTERKIALRTKFGPLTASDRVIRVVSETADTLKTKKPKDLVLIDHQDLRIYSFEPKRVIGAMAGLIQSDLSADSAGFQFGASFGEKLVDSLYVTSSFDWLYLQGSVPPSSPSTSDGYTYQANAGVLLGGILWAPFREYMLSPRFEVSAGIAFAGTTTSNDFTLMPNPAKSTDKFGTGVSGSARFGGEIGWNQFSAWTPSLGYQYTLINQGGVSSLFARATVVLK